MVDRPVVDASSRSPRSMPTAAAGAPSAMSAATTPSTRRPQTPSSTSRKAAREAMLAARGNRRTTRRPPGGLAWTSGPTASVHDRESNDQKWTFNKMEPKNAAKNGEAVPPLATHRRLFSGLKT
jgi:hypothetical protein